MAYDPSTSDVDDLLADLHSLIDDDDIPAAEPEDFFLPDDLTIEPEEPQPQKKSWTQTQRLPKHVAKLQNNQEKAYAEWLYAQEEHSQEAPQTSKGHWSQKQQVPKYVEQLQNHQEEAYALWQAEQEDYHQPADHSRYATHVELPEEEPEEPRKKRRGFRSFLLTLVILALACVAVVAFVLPSQPAEPSALGERKEGVSTILLAGTDESGARTDTLMLLTVNRPEKSLSLVSIPRDTLVNGNYTVPKINSVYGVNNGGEEGMDMLLTRVGECIGFRPDGYMLIELEAFAKLVDAMGGLYFDVPVDMFYNDPAQDLYINLVAGSQTLTGEEAMGVVRFRSGYADADLGRVQVQRDVLSAMIDQLISVEGVAKSPQLLQIVLKHTDSDLSTPNLLWLAESALLADRSNIQTVTLPGTARNFTSGSYYVLDPTLVAQTVNTYCNPYETQITPEHLNIRLG